jgi:ubiquinone/menaquinone biosynthesis C-methylase UbiE
MITKPEKIIKRIIKAVGAGQSVLVMGDWQEELIKGIKEKQNILSFAEDDLDKLSFEDNLFTRIVADYTSPIFNDEHFFFNEARRLLLPTGMIIISANCKDGIFDKVIKFFRRDHIKEEGIKKIKPKFLQDQIHDHGFLIDGYYGYPGGHLLMMAQIQNKEVSTLFVSDKQETIAYNN